MFSCKPYEVDTEIPIFPSSDDEPVGLEHYFVEPGCREDWVSGLLDLDALQIEKCFNIEDITGTFDYDQTKLDTDTSDSQIHEGEGKNPQFHSNKSQGIITRIHGENHSDAKHTDEVTNASYGRCKTESSDKVVELSSKSISVFKNTKNLQYSLFDQVVAKDPHEAFKDVSGLESLVICKNWPKHDLSLLENYTELESNVNLIEYEIFSDENEDQRKRVVLDAHKQHNMPQDQPMKRKRIDGYESSLTSTSECKTEHSSLDEEEKAGKIASPKRSRKPPRRYIEESLEYELKPFNKKYGIGKRSKDRIMLQKWQRDLPAEQVGFEDDSFNVGCIQVPFGLPVEKEHPKKSKPSLVLSYEDPKDCKLIVPYEKLDIEPLSVESQDDLSEDESLPRCYTPKGNIRRKRHISWTQEEVVMLVDGVTQCGVGRWTEIKRLLFSSSSHRTSVDLKDKWRNLLRASCAQLQIKEKVENGRKQASNYVSESILWRVRELSVLYPYPRENRAKVSCTVPAVASFPSRTPNALVPMSTVV